MPDGSSETLIAPAQIEWRADVPYSPAFQDVYFAPDAALETARVMLRPTRFEARCAARPGTHTVGELGFGTGLNFAITVEHYLRTAPASGRLHYVALDAHPLDGPAMARVVDALPRLVPDAERLSVCRSVLAPLAAHYPPLIRGWHRRRFADGRVTLSLYFGPAADGLADLAVRQPQPVDTWFLDGFAPDRNPEMWSVRVIDAVAELSAAGAWLATFTAVGAVRRRLRDAGFAVGRVDQMPHKLHSLAGVFEGRGRTAPALPAHVAVAGAGFAGASTARHLADRGIPTTVYDPGGHAAGASGLPATVLHGRLTADGTAAAQLRVQAFDYAVAYTRGRAGITRTGALQQQGATRTPDQLQTIAARYRATGTWVEWLDGPAARAIDPVAPPEGALWFPQAGVVDGRALIDDLLTHPLITLARTRLPDATCGPVVVATASDAGDRAITDYLELAPVAGQVERVRLPVSLHCAHVGAAYLAPLPNGDVVTGATYEHTDWPGDAARRHNLDRISARFDGNTTWLASHRAVRAVTSDRLPIAGAAYDAAHDPVDGVWLNTGHGSIGACSTHLAADIVASRLCGEIPPVGADVEAAISSLRFRRRQARRGVWPGSKRRRGQGSERDRRG